MRRFLLFLIVPIFFFLFNNTQTVSASATCYTNVLDPSTAFTVENTCFANIDCPTDSYCDYWSAWCGGIGGPCKPLDCKDCKVAQNHKCIFQFTSPPSWAPNCCSYSCSEGGLPNSYSASLYDQKCYSYTNIQTDVNNCGSCGNKCSSGYDCKSGKCTPRACKRCADNTACDDCSSVNSGKRCVDVGGAGLLQLDTSCKPYVPCTSCLEDGTAVGACNSAGQRCSDVNVVCKLQTDATCAGGGTTCSGYSDEQSCDYSKTLNCDWCATAFPSPYCAPEWGCGTVTSCSGIAQANCVGDCAWCASKNNCVVGKDYAGQCDSNDMISE